MRRLMVYVFTLLTILPYYIQTTPLEAAFQGQCEDGVPCEQSCFNLHDTMYECYCHEGFFLHSNGYNCIAFNATNPDIDGESQSGDSGSNISIQIEVDIEPPEDGERLSDDQLAKLGLPSKHIHYTAAAGAADAGQEHTAELLQPADIQVSYAESDQEPGQVLTRDTVIRDTWEPRDLDTRDGYVSVPELENEEVDPPRALPDTGASVPLEDNIYTVDAYCGLECGGGECGITETGAKRCLCPPGWGGAGCGDLVMMSGAPRLSGLSHLTLPTLQNAYSDLHMALDFKPETNNGVILITGQTDDMTGDYLALILNDGYVELRLDCGTGPGLVRSSQRVALGSWNHLSVFRHDWAVWLQLNSGHKEEGRSQGLFSRITFNQPLYVGGVGEMKNVRSFLGLDAGLVGCVRRLEINDRYYNLEAAVHGGDITAGRDIASCEEGHEGRSCSPDPCHHGRCQLHYQEPVCECSLGFSGSSCEDSQEIEVAKFSGSSYIRYPGLGDSALIWLAVEIIFKPEARDGILLYNGDRNDGRGDFMAVVLDDGFVVFLMDLGSGVGLSRSVERVELGAWHNVTVQRTGGEILLHVDSQTVTRSQSGGGFSQLSLADSLMLGGVPDLMRLPPALASDLLTGYRGCVASLTINSLPTQLLFSAVSSVAVTACVPESRDPASAPTRAPAPQITRVGSRHVAPAFSGRSFLAFNSSDIYTNLIGNSNLFNIRLRLTSSDSIILWAGGNTMDMDSDFIMLAVQDGFVQFSFNLGSGWVQIEYNNTRVDDGLWHRVRATRLDQSGALQVDNGDTVRARAPGQLTQLNTNPTLFLGGVPDSVTDATTYYTGLVGCLTEFSLGNIGSIDMLARAERGRNVDICEK